MHTEVPEELRGRGTGSELVRQVLELARARGLEVWPKCAFVHWFIEQNPEWVELVSKRYPKRAELEGA